MTPRRLMFLTGTVALAVAISQGVASAQGYNKEASARAAENRAQDASAIAQQTPSDAALNPTGPTMIASQPVPDTAANRAAFGQPLSRAGKRTAPIGD